ncbi:MAG: YdcF family protein, partial [Gammaproteobacteria bacterium]|nr:YdcF family protein [Gammaproteobacteria bacterium]
FFRWVEAGAVRPDPAVLPKADAVVVLSGMMRHVESDIGRESPTRSGLYPEWGEAADRFFAGVELFERNKGEVLIFTGGLLPWQQDVESEGAYLARYAVGLGIDPARIRVTQDVVNTEGEARAIAKMLIPAPAQSEPKRARIILVTSAFHMPRAQLIFEEAGLQVIPYPVDFRISAEGRDPTDFFPDPKALDRTDIAIRELIGRAFYRLKYVF